MNWSFCIVFNKTDYLNRFVKSIINQEGLEKDRYQIVLVGKESGSIDSLVQPLQDNGIDIIHIPFDESTKTGWITRKKNLAVQMSKYENLVISHDYFALCRGWYKSFENFGCDWDVCMNQIRLLDNRRFRDWCYPRQWWGDWDWLKYDDNSKTHQMYISGSYWCAKKSYMAKNRLDENRTWGQGEDCEWSARCRENWVYKMNKDAVVKILKGEDFMKMNHPPEPIPDPEIHLNFVDYQIQD